MPRLRLSRGAWRQLAHQIDPSRTTLNFQTRLGYGLGGLYHSLLFWIQDTRYAEALKTTSPDPPVFILGFWRSGTTYLHELLCCDPRFGFPSTYACLNPSHFLLTEASRRFHSAPQTTRPMDAMSYSWMSPQEDEFALLALGAPSPYQALVVPSLMQDPKALVDSRTSVGQKPWLEVFGHFLKLLTIQQHKPMVFKSPSHGFKLSMLLSNFPDALYILIERNPYEVFASNLKLWRTLLDLYAVESWDDSTIEEFVLEAYRIHEHEISNGSRLARPGQLARVCYEDLVVDPVREMERLYEELRIADFDSIRERLKSYTRGVAGHTRNRFVITKEQKKLLETCWGPFIEAGGHAWPEKYVSVN
jgi:omega-hydroxy-beta-dihydromenaquinone-9 sulfotransferase